MWFDGMQDINKPEECESTEESSETIAKQDQNQFGVYGCHLIFFQSGSLFFLQELYNSCTIKKL